MKNQSGPLDYDIATEDIISTVKTLKLNKYNFGIVTNEVLKCNPEAIATPLCLIFNNILNSKLFPNSWNLSLIKPIHKCGTFSKHDNYRGICNSNHLSNLFTALKHKTLEKWSVKENVLPDNSLGFRKGLRTEDGIFILTTLLDKYAKRGERIFSCFVDFAKFYDSISHNLLFIKLAEKGISGNFYFLLKNMYSNCSYAIKVLLPCDPLCGKKNTKKKTISYQWFRTSSFRAKTGLRQGCNLSPLLANVFLSDLHESLDIGHYYAPQLLQESITSISWADDLLILSINSAGLQKGIENLEEYTQNGI